METSYHSGCLSETKRTGQLGKLETAASICKRGELGVLADPADGTADGERTGVPLPPLVAMVRMEVKCVETEPL